MFLSVGSLLGLGLGPNSWARDKVRWRGPGEGTQVKETREGCSSGWCGLLLSRGSLPEVRAGPSSGTRDKLGQYGSGEGTLETESGRGKVQGAGWSLTSSGWYGLLLCGISSPRLGTGPIRRTRNELGLYIPRKGTP